MANGFTISDLLQSENLCGLSLIAGADGADNLINNANTIDNLDTFDWLRAGDFLLTTGYIYKDDPMQLIDVFRKLSRINCSGIGIKVHRYFESLPASVLEEANKLGFPVIDVPLKYSLADVSNTISSNVRSNQEHYFTEYLCIHNSFNECVLSGGGANALVDVLFGYVQNPIVLLDSRWRILAYNDPNGEIEHLHLKTEGIKQEFIDTVPETLVGKAKIITRAYPDGDTDIVTRVATLEDGASSYGYILVMETSHKMEWMEFVALESAAVPLVLERIKAKQLSEVKHQLRQDFFDDLLMGRISSVNAARSLAEIHGMDIRKTYLCMVIQMNEITDYSEYGEQDRNDFIKTKSEILRFVERKGQRCGRDIVSILRSNLIISFYHVPNQLVRQHAWEILDGFPEELARELQASYSISFSIGVGTPIQDYLNIKASYYQANEAIKYASQNDSVCVFYYENFMVDQLLGCVQDEQILKDFVRLSIGALVDYDSEHSTNLVETLEIYFECNANVSIAAKRLFLHRNSLIYRMDRIKDILNTDLKNPTELLTLQVGLRVNRILASR